MDALWFVDTFQPEMKWQSGIDLGIMLLMRTGSVWQEIVRTRDRLRYQSAGFLHGLTLQ